MKKLFSILLLSFSFLGNAQGFLLNGGFEEENTCTEYRVDCAPEAWLTNDDVFSNYFKDKNRAHGGLHCLAIEAGHAKKSFKRTFFRSQLVCGLRSGGEYAIAFYIKSPHKVLDSIGIYFSSYDFLFDNRPLQSIIPQVYLGDKNSFSEKDTGWQKVQIIYRANGDESFFTIANFSKRDITGPTGIELENNFFVFIDDVSLIAMDNRENLCNDWLQRKKDIYNQDERHLFLRKKIKDGKQKLLQPVVLTSSSLLVVDTLVLPNILFAIGSAELQPAIVEELENFCKTIAGKRIDSIIVEGHTDNSGTLQFNEKLSLDRASAVGNYFVEKSVINNTQLITRGWASLKPIVDNSTDSNRQRNRRVEIFVYMK